MKTWVREAAKRTRQPHFGPALIYGVDQTLLYVFRIMYIPSLYQFLSRNLFHCSDPALQSAFVQLDCDEETRAFLNVHKL